MWIVNIALRRPYTFIVAALLILLSLPYVLRNMATDILPDIDIPVVAEIWEYRGLSPREVGDRVTRIAERELAFGVDNIEHSESVSYSGFSIIKVYFQPGTDIRTAMNQVLMSTTAAYRSMPQGVQPGRVRQYSATDLPLIQLGLSSDSLSDTELGDLAGTVVRPLITAKKGVSLTYPYGAKGRQVSVDLDGKALLANGLTPADIVTAMGSQNLILPTGTIKLGESEYEVSLNGAIASIPRIGDIPLRTVNGRTLLLRDVANVRDGFSPATTIARQNGERGVINSVLKLGGISTLEVVQHVKDSLPKLIEKLPSEVDIKLMFDQSIFVRAAIGNVLHEALIAAALTAAMILLFLGNWRSTCIIAVSIPLSIAASLIVLYLIGETINLMTLGGLALAVGILVDDATVEIENIERQLGLGKNPQQAILDGAAEIAVPAFVSTLCICIVFVPMFFLSGVAKSLFVPLAEAVVFAMLASYILSRTLVPTLVMYMMRGHRQQSPPHGQRPSPPLQGEGQGGDGVDTHAQGYATHPHPPPVLPLEGGGAIARHFVQIHHRFNHYFEALREHYVVLLAHVLQQRKRFATLFFGFSLASLALVPLLGQDLFPVVDAGQLRLHLRTAPGTRLEEMPALVNQVEDVIRQQIPREQLADIIDIIGGPYSTMNTLFGNSGTAEASDSEVMISLKPGHDPSYVYMDRLRRELTAHFPGVEFFFQPADQVSQTLNFGVPAPIDVQLIGGKAEEIQPLLVDIDNALRRIPGLVDVHLHQRWSKPTLALEMNRTQLQQLGLSARNVAENLLIALSGSMQTTPTYWLNPANGNTYNIGARSLETDLDSLDALLHIPVSPGNGAEPQLLGNLVNIKRGVQPAIVSHYNISDMANIYANVQGRDLGAVSHDIDAVLDSFRAKLPKGVDLDVRGQIQTLNSSFSGLAIGIAVAILLVYLLVVVNFQSWLDPLIIISALPAALAGIVWMLFLSGTTLSVPALTGTIMTMGVATANSILLVSFARSRLAAGVPPLSAALEAAATRLRPVLMTALAMIAGMLPMALGLGEGGEQNAPLGRAVIGGLLFATVSTLLFVPVVFASTHRWLERRYSAGHGIALTEA